MNITKPDFSYERKLWRRGYCFVAGTDEVGRGCFAGPVVAGCVIFAKDMVIPELIEINDSKKLTPRRRTKASIWIKENSLGWGIGEVSVSYINRLGMAQASRMAFRLAVREANSRLSRKIKLKDTTPIEFLLLDAFYIPYIKGLRRKNQRAIIDGDEKSISIAAASIIAKVYRDKIMLRTGLMKKYKVYGWGRNKGYGTREHQATLLKLGQTRYHRKVFVSTFLKRHLLDGKS